MGTKYTIVPNESELEHPQVRYMSEDVFIKWWSDQTNRTDFRYIIVISPGKSLYIMRTVAEVDEWVYGLTQSPVGKPTPSAANPKDAINPSHYKNYMGHDLQLQWLEAMQYLPHFQDPDWFKAAVEMQIRKYLDRCGGKDNELQELKKALWYLEFLTAYVANGNKPIRVDRVREILNAK